VQKHVSTNNDQSHETAQGLFRPHYDRAPIGRGITAEKVETEATLSLMTNNRPDDL
jgi:hypothetical protein